VCCVVRSTFALTVAAFAQKFSGLQVQGKVRGLLWSEVWSEQRRETFAAGVYIQPVTHSSGGRPSLLASGSAGAMAPRQSPLAALLQPITQRMDALELMFSDLHPETVTRVLDRMHELEKTTRDNVNAVMRIMDVREAAVTQASEIAETRCEASVQRAEEACQRLADAGDRHQNEARGLRQELGNLKDIMGTKFEQMMSGVETQVDEAQKRVEQVLQKWEDEVLQKQVDEGLQKLVDKVLQQRVDEVLQRLVARSQDQLQKRVDEVLQKRVDELTLAGTSGDGVRRGRAFLQAQREVRSRSASAHSVESHTIECHRVAMMRSPRATGHGDADHTRPAAPHPHSGTAPFRAHHSQPAGSSWGIVPHLPVETDEAMVRPVLLGNVAGTL